MVQFCDKELPISLPKMSDQQCSILYLRQLFTVIDLDVLPLPFPFLLPFRSSGGTVRRGIGRRRPRSKLAANLVRRTDDGHFVLRVQIAVVEARKGVQRQEAAAGPRRDGRVVHVGGVVQGVDIGEGTLGVGQAGLV